MITGQIKSQIDQIWEIFWTGGITNSITIEEQKKLVKASIADLETLLASRMDYWFND